MRGVYLILFVGILFVTPNVAAQNLINFHQSTAVSTYQLYDDDSIYFDASHLTTYFSNNGSIYSFVTSSIDSITFTKDQSNNVYIDYQAGTVTVSNPWSATGVNVTVNGEDVEVNSYTTQKDINYILSGSTTNGSFKIYSDKRFNLIMNEVSIVNPVGPAVNIQSEKTARIHLLTGTTSYLSDGVTYDAPPLNNGVEEDQKATLFGEGKIEIYGGGELQIVSNGDDQHAMSSDEDIEIKEGQISISNATKDGIHVSEKFQLKGGAITIGVNGDGLDVGEELEIECGTLTINTDNSDTKSIASDSILLISGGDIIINTDATQTKAIKSKKHITINGGSIAINQNGSVDLISSGSGYDPAYHYGIKADSTVEINGGQITISIAGTGGRGVDSDSEININGGELTINSSGNGATYSDVTGTTDAYHNTCIRSNGDIYVNDGIITAENSGTGGKGIDVDGSVTIGNSSTGDPQVSLTTTGNSITISSGGGGPGGPGGGGPGGTTGDTDEAKTMKADLNVTINNGVISIDSADDGIKAGENIVINGGEITIENSVEGVEAKFITVEDGTIEINCSDDGFNATHGSGGESADGSLLLINGGYCYINATGGDGLDSNGDVTVNGGTVVVHGPQSSPEVGLDYNGTGLVNGGYVIISGTNSNMTQGFESTSMQKSFIIKSSQSLSTSTLIHIEDASGNELCTFIPNRSYYSLVFSSDAITQGTTYKVYTGGSHTGTNTNGLYSNGTYSGGTLKQTFTATNTVTTVSF